MKLYVEFLTAIRGFAVSEEEVRSMTAAAIKNVDQARFKAEFVTPHLQEKGDN